MDRWQLYQIEMDGKMIILDHAQYYHRSTKAERNLEVYLCSDILQREMKLFDYVRVYEEPIDQVLLWRDRVKFKHLANPERVRTINDSTYSIKKNHISLIPIPLLSLN